MRQPPGAFRGNVQETLRRRASAALHYSVSSACLIKELECVALAADLPDYGLAVGDVRAVVHDYDGGRSYQVEFTAFDGRTVAAAKVPVNQIRPIGDREIHHARAFEPAVR